MTIKEIAELTGRSKRTVERWITCDKVAQSTCDKMSQAIKSQKSADFTIEPKEPVMETAIVKMFEYHDRKVRTVMIDGDPWFVAKDVCDVLGLTNSRESITRVYDDDVSQTDSIAALTSPERKHVA